MAGFLEKMLRSGADILERSLTVESWSRRQGFLQKTDPRLKILMLVVLLLLCSLARSHVHLAILYATALLLAVLSRIDPLFFTKRVWIFIPAFSGLIALPALVLIPGSPLFSIGPLTVTREGSTAAAFLVLRVSSSVSFTLLFVLTTPWNEAMKALRGLRVPAVAVSLLAISYRYLLLLIRTLSELLTARKSRVIGRTPRRQEMDFVSRSAGFLFLRSLYIAEGVHMAMISRGYTGDPSPAAREGDGDGDA
jgi:cobalt/nickel transport system permease protein